MQNPGPALVRGMWAAVAIACLILILRVIAKIKINHFRADDVLMIVAWALTLSATVLLQESVDHGFGYNLLTLPTSDVQVVLKAIAIEVPLVTISTGLARCSFVVYLLGILGTNKTYQIILWSVMLLQLAGNIVSGVLPLSICRDVRILWDASIKTTCGDTAAIIKFAYFSSAVNSATDLFLAIFPTVVFWNLNLKLRIKISLMTLMSLGILAMVASIIKTTKYNDIPGITNLGAQGGIELIRWGFAENLVIITTSSVPCIRPLLISSVRKFSSAARSRSYELSGPFTGHKGTARNTAVVQSRARDHEPDEETDSIERILRSAERGEYLLDSSGPGITKQVEISVTRHNDQSDKGSHDYL